MVDPSKFNLGIDLLRIYYEIKAKLGEVGKLGIQGSKYHSSFDPTKVQPNVMSL